MEQNPTTRLIESLKNTSLNQSEIADKTGVSVSTVSRWFSGQTSHISKSKRKYIANAMNINLHYVEEGSQLPSDSVGDPEVAYADEVELPEDGKLTRDQMKEFLRQIEAIAKILKDSL